MIHCRVLRSGASLLTGSVSSSKKLLRSLFLAVVAVEQICFSVSACLSYGGLLASEVHNCDCFLMVVMYFQKYTIVIVSWWWLCTFNASKPLEVAWKAHNYNYVDRVTVSAFDASKSLEPSFKSHIYSWVFLFLPLGLSVLPAFPLFSFSFLLHNESSVCRQKMFCFVCAGHGRRWLLNPNLWPSSGLLVHITLLTR